MNHLEKNIGMEKNYLLIFIYKMFNYRENTKTTCSIPLFEEFLSGTKQNKTSKEKFYDKFHSIFFSLSITNVSRIKTKLAETKLQ